MKRGVLRAFVPVEVLAVVPWDWRAYRAKGSQYGNGWRRWRFLTVEAGGRGAKISKAARLQDHAPNFENATGNF